MNTVLTFLGNIKLSLSQIVVCTVTLIVGGLVVALRLQGSKLHATQISLLQAQYANALDDQERKVSAAEKKYLEAYKTFEASK